MNITFLIGNGFDIGLGLNSSYESFYEQYCISNDKDSDNIKAFKAFLRERNTEHVKKIIDWADFEKAFGEHSIAFSKENKAEYIERFEHFVMAFNKYIEAQEARVNYPQDGSIGKTMLNAISAFWDLRPAEKDVISQILTRDASERVYNFITFNYTRTMDKCVEHLKIQLRNEPKKRVGQVLHIHGFTDHAMIMGVNDPQQILNPDFSNDEDIIREIVKPRQNSDGRTNYEKDAVKAIKDSNIICIYGMSLGETDKQWWQLLSAWLEKHTNNILIILSYSREYSERFPFLRKKTTDKIIERFLTYSNHDLEIKERISKQIYVGINHNIFSIPLCKKEAANVKPTITSESASLSM